MKSVTRLLLPVVIGLAAVTLPGRAQDRVPNLSQIATRQEPVGTYDQQTFDVYTQYHTTLGAHQDLVAGGGYQVSDNKFAGHVGISLTPGEDTSSLLTAFSAGVRLRWTFR